MTTTLPLPAPTRTAPTTTTFRGLAYDAFDAQASAEFWAAALRSRVAPGASPQRAELLDAPGTGAPHLVFRQVTDGRSGTPLHLQLTTDDLDGEATRLLRLGARRLGTINDRGRRWMTLADPEGNSFDLLSA